MQMGAKAVSNKLLENARTTHDNAFKITLVERTLASVIHEAKA
jgi:xanthine dehydrogenase YagS FAD-binding subunit